MTVIEQRIDLHTHTSFSDGTLTPEELVFEAKRIGLAAIAVTDHDTCDGLPRAVSAGRKAGIPVIRGCELSTRTERGEMHILGLWVPENDPSFEKELARLRNFRNERNAKILEKLRALGCDITEEDLALQAKGRAVGRPHIALALLAKGCVKSRAQAFHQYIGEGAKAYVPKETITPDQGCRLLKKVGATVCVAHPMLHKYPMDWLYDTLKRLVSCGLDALEAWHTEHSPQETALCREWALKLGLGLTGGSDFHGANKQGVSLGSGRNNLYIPFSVLTALRERRRACGLPLDDALDE